MGIKGVEGDNGNIRIVLRWRSEEELIAKVAKKAQRPQRILKEIKDFLHTVFGRIKLFWVKFI